MDKTLLTHPLLINQIAEAKLVLEYADQLFSILKTEREDMVDPILVDLLIKLFRKEVCERRDCTACVSCIPSQFMNTKEFIHFIQTKKDSIIQTISTGFNNSFNVPQRWIYVQKIIDRLFEEDANLLIIEIGCWWGQIGKFLTNSNMSKKYFKNNFKESEYDNRFVQYYGIDPNLQIDIKQQLMMINGGSPEMQRCRDVFREFNDLIQDDERIFLKKAFLNQDTLPSILQNLKKMYSNIKSWDVYIIFLTSVMKYHFKYKKDHDLFMNNLYALAHTIESTLPIKNIYYISNEVYGKDNKLYPFESNEYAKLQIKSAKFSEGVFKKEIVYPEYSRYF